ncbi:hypothetical protein VN12_16210 [Pirellula sp. SH-Sr6A]|nr:hypothetical protein VN12_16210 [Pirellula sp. SH-Sr6A]
MDRPMPVDGDLECIRRLWLFVVLLLSEAVLVLDRSSDCIIPYRSTRRTREMLQPDWGMKMWRVAAVRVCSVHRLGSGGLRTTEHTEHTERWLHKFDAPFPCIPCRPWLKTPRDSGGRPLRAKMRKLHWSLARALTSSSTSLAGMRNYARMPFTTVPCTSVNR